MKKVISIVLTFLTVQMLFGVSEMKENFTYKTGSSNIIMADFPDPDVIRVNDTYYMISTTMHMMPGAVILRSYNLLDWEHCSFIYSELDETPRQQLKDNKGIYGKGMWAASLRYHNSLFYVTFVCNDTGKTYLYTSENIQGPWKKSVIPGFFHDMSILFDDDGKAYLVSGNTDIRLTEMEPDLSKPKVGGVNKVIIQDDRSKIILGYEGSHFYKINGKYYIFFIHWPKGKMRTEACFVSDTVDGPYTGCDVLHSDLGRWNSGCAQGGIIQANDGQWYGIVFQDHGALGRIPVLDPVTFNEEGFPVFQSPVPAQVTVADNKPGYQYAPLYSNDFTNAAWQWNHQPDLNLISRTSDSLTITTDKLVSNVTQAANTLSERTFTERCSGTVQIDASSLNNGDFAGLCALEGIYYFIAVTKDKDEYFLVLAKRASDNIQMGQMDSQAPAIIQKVKLESPVLTLRADFILSKVSQNVTFSYCKEGELSFTRLGSANKLSYTLDMFMGVRFGLFCYSTEQTGGSCKFNNFVLDK